MYKQQGFVKQTVRLKMLDLIFNYDDLLIDSYRIAQIGIIPNCLYKPEVLCQRIPLTGR